jgi:sister-chromatid-cohesion protein PDS5
MPSLLRHIKHAPVPETEASDADISDIEKYDRVAKHVLTYISKHCPILYKPHVAELVKSLSEKNPHSVEVALQALAALGWEAGEQCVVSLIFDL